MKDYNNLLVTLTKVGDVKLIDEFITIFYYLSRRFQKSYSFRKRPRFGDYLYVVKVLCYVIIS